MLAVQPEGQWDGVSSEAAQAQRAWRAMEDNPLWILTERVRAHSEPRVRRSRNTALAIWALVLLGLYGTVFAGILLTRGWPDPSDLAGKVIFAVVCPLAFVYLLYATSQLALNGQAWLGRERGDARNVQAALLDPLLGLTLLQPRDVIVAALRQHMRLILLAAGTGAAAAGSVALFAAGQDNNLPVALLMLPVTLAGYFIPGVLGGCLLLLLSISLGLNSATPLQRTALVFLFVGHQLVSLFGGLVMVAGLGLASGNESMLMLGGAIAAHIYLPLAAWAGLRLVLTVGRAGTGWLLAMPLIWVIGFWVLIGMLALYQSLYLPGSQPFYIESMGSMALNLAAAWGAVNLFAPGNLATSLSFGSGDIWNSGALLLIPLLYVLRLAMLLVLCGMAYRAALYCAELRLRAVD